MKAMLRLLRSLLHRPGTALMISLLALVASASASIAPMYYASARDSILHDELASGPVAEQGFEITWQGAVNGAFEPLSTGYQSGLARTMPDAAMRARVLEPATEAIETTAVFPSAGDAPVLAWRADVCSHLHVVVGACPTKTNDVTISASLAKRNSWQVGEKVQATGWPTLVITGIYATPNFRDGYWFNRGSTYFPAEDGGRPADISTSPAADAMFTVRQTVDHATAVHQGIVVIDQLFALDRIRAGDLSAVSRTVGYLPVTPGLGSLGVSLESAFPAVADRIHASWRSLEVTEFLIGVQLLVLVWLLMFLVIKDAIDVRGPEIALMKLRGYKGFRLLRFALAEVVALLAAALPVGVLLGWAMTAVLARSQLRAGTPSRLSLLAWAAAAVATVGGLAAAAVAGRRTLRRPIVDEWRRTTRQGADRGWVIDAMLLTAAVAGLVAIEASGQVTTVKHGSLSLLEPGLLGLAVAVVASRALPFLCRRLFGTTRRRGGLSIFLAVRHIARRPGAVRTTIILATAFALATFGIIAWSTGDVNRALVARVSVGAPTVYTVAPPANKDLGEIVDSVDPSGRHAAVVETYYNGGPELLAVDPDRFAHVAEWRDAFAGAPLAALAAKLKAPVAPSLVLEGDAVRVHLHVDNLSKTGQVVELELTHANGSVPTQTELGSLDVASGQLTLSADLAGCPCYVRNLVISPPTASPFGTAVPTQGAVVIDGIDVQRNGAWSPVAGVTRPGQWRADSSGAVAQLPSGPRWSFTFGKTGSAVLSVADLPSPIPAIASSSAVNGTAGGQVQTLGLDGQLLTVTAVATSSAIPGATTAAVVVNRTYAERAANGYVSGSVNRQVWVARGFADRVESGLKEAGVRILDVSSADARQRLLNRQGAGLASVAFLADSIAAAALAAGAAITGLVIAARRRRYEYVALMATGAARRMLHRGLLFEQAGVLLFGALAGTVSGVVTALVVLRSVPVFVATPTSLPLTYLPTGAVFGFMLVTVIGGLFLIALISSRVLLTGLRGEQLREAAP